MVTLKLLGLGFGCSISTLWNDICFPSSPSLTQREATPAEGKGLDNEATQLG